MIIKIIIKIVARNESVNIQLSRLSFPAKYLHRTTLSVSLKMTMKMIIMVTIAPFIAYYMVQ